MKSLVYLALVGLFLSTVGGTLGADTATKKKPASTAHSTSVPRHSTTPHNTYSHRRKPAPVWSPWHVSSFGEPAAGDNPMGEERLVRAAAIEALGNFNGSVVVADPNTGRILSIVNQKLALSGAFTPCSTFKPVVAAAALKEGIISGNTRIQAETRFRYYYGTSRINVAQALAYSSNEFFAKLGEMLGFRRVSQYAREFGLGEKAGLNIPNESPGVFPLAPPKQGGVGLLTSFGQDIEYTPLQLAAIVSAIANGGTLYYLQYPRTPEEIGSFHAEVHRSLADIAPYLPQVREGMAAAVRQGTGRLAYNPDEAIFGKTGTCSEDGARLGWFASYSSEERPKYVVVVLLRGGRMMFGPHAAEIAGRVYRGLPSKDKLAAQALGFVSFAGSGRE
jgi:penicillin-binding protein 2